MTSSLRRAVSTITLLLACSAPSSAACPGDCNGSGIVSFEDLVCAIFEFGTANPAADCDGSGVVEFADLICILFNFGDCPDPGLGPMVMDGTFSDWAGVLPVATDDLGDASGAFDFTSVSVATRDTTLYVRFDTNNIRNLQSGSSADGTIEFSVEGPSGDVFTADIRDRQYELNGGNISHADASFSTSPTFASDEFELTMDLSIVGAELGDAITISFAGSDEFDAPIVHTLTDAADPPFAQSVDRDASTDLRVVALNVRQRGLTDGQRGPAIRRLLKGIDADVYCFQEQWDGTVNVVQNAMALAFADESDGREVASNWNVAIESGTAIATVLPFEQMNVPGTREAGGIVTLPGGERVFVLSIHLKCCGSIGTSEDFQRIGAANGYAAFFGSLLDTEPGLGIVVSGDWNLVGSRTPLNILTDVAVGLVEAEPLQNGRRASATWRNAGSSFAPGRLDLTAFSDGVLAPMNLVLFDSAQHDPAALAALGILSSDSAASDHLMLVSDFRVID